MTMKMAARVSARAAAAALALAALVSCSGSERENPPAIGGGTEEYKRSPCACITIPQRYPPGWREEAERRLRGA